MPDYNIATQVQVPDAMKSIGSLINFAGGAQNLQRGAVELQKSRETMQADIDRARALSRQAGAEARVSEETADPRISQAKTAAGVAQWHFDAEQGKTVQQIMGGLLADPAVMKGDSKGIVDALIGAEHTMRGQGIPEAKIRAQLAPAYMMATLKPGEFGTHLKNMVVGGVAPSGQGAAVTPGGPVIGSGQETTQFNVNPLAPQGQGANIAVQQQLPPTTQTFDPNTNAPGYLGAQKITGNAPDDATALRIVQDASKRGQGATIQSGPALGVPATVEGQVGTMQRHFTEAANNVASSALLEGIAQNIKTFSQRAIVGTEQERLAFINGILEKLGSPGAADLKTATDLMEKNMAQLAKNSPAATDAARVVNQLASPHPTMNEHAIADAADQIIGQVRMSKDIYKAFLPQYLAEDRKAYLEKIGKVSDITDARVWQFESMGAADRERMVAAMKPEDRTAFKDKIKKAEEMGFFK